MKDLKVAWEVHTGDVVRKGDHQTNWGATPLFVNNTVYIGTPLFRAFAVEPDTGKVKWIYDAAGEKKIDNQGNKNRGVAYWASSAPEAGQPCQKIVYLGTVQGTLHALDADTGKTVHGLRQGRHHRCQPVSTVNHKWNVGLLQPPAVYKDTLILGWAGLDWDYEVENPGTVYGHRRPAPAR